RVKFDENPVKYTSLKERLEVLIEQRKERQLDFEDLFEMYQEMREELTNLDQESQSYGLKDTKQLPFYQLLENQAPEGIEQEKIKDLTELITEIIQDNAVIDWVEKEDVKRNMR